MLRSFYPLGFIPPRRKLKRPTGALRTAARRAASGFGALGATDSWSVKAYTVSGKTVWASYQSPATNAVLVALQAALGRLGIPTKTDGVIGADTVRSMTVLVWCLQFLGDQATGGSTVSNKRTTLLVLGASGATFLADKIAKNGAAIELIVTGLSNDGSVRTSVKNLAARYLSGQGAPSGGSRPSTSSTPVATAPSSTSPYVPVPSELPPPEVAPAMFGGNSIALAGAAIVAGWYVAKKLKKGGR